VKLILDGFQTFLVILTNKAQMNLVILPKASRAPSHLARIHLSSPEDKQNTNNQVFRIQNVQYIFSADFVKFQFVSCFKDIMWKKGCSNLAVVARQQRKLSTATFELGRPSIGHVVRNEFQFMTSQLVETAQRACSVFSPLSTVSFGTVASMEEDDHILNMGSTMKKRSDKMNKHKLKKRRKSLAMNTKHNRK